MKIVVIMRGSEPARSDVALELMYYFNHTVNETYAFLIQATDWLKGPNTDLSAAYTTCKNYLKKFMVHMELPIVVVNNDFKNQGSWRSYRKLCETFGDFRMVGIDVGPDVSEQFAREMDMAFAPGVPISDIVRFIVS